MATLEDICSDFVANAGADEVVVAGTAFGAICSEFVEAGAVGHKSFGLAGAGEITFGLRTAGDDTLKLGAKAGTQDVGICGVAFALAGAVRSSLVEWAA